MSEFPVKPKRPLIALPCSLFCGGECCGHANRSSCYCGFPFGAIVTLMNAIESGCIGRMLARIGSVLLTCCHAQIAAPIVKAIAVFVVAKLALCQSHDGPMHQHAGSICASPCAASTSVILSRRSYIGVPFPLHQPSVIGNIDKRNLSVTKRNLSVQWGRWGWHLALLESVRCAGVTSSYNPIVLHTTAALTGGGTQGSMTFTAGILTAQTPAT